MIEVKGKYNTAKIYTDVVEEKAIAQIYEICNQNIFEGSTIRIMPDVHAGAGCTIGTTMTITDKIIPNLVGVDIGCGMETVVLKEKEIDLERLDEVIHKRIPYGRNTRTEAHPFAKKARIEELYCYKEIKGINKENKAIGSLGGGNHFIEVDKDDEGSLYLVVHSGSRHLGKTIAEYYQKEAYNRLTSHSKEEIDAVIDQLKKEGRDKEIEATVKKMKKEKKTGIRRDLAYCENDLFDAYIHDMKIMQEFADLNRKAMIDEIVKQMNFHIVDQFTTIHNYIDTKNMILRKGAVSAQKDEMLLIPINMRDGSLICKGKGNTDWNCSAPHGAGRLMSRMAAKSNFNVQEFEKAMEGIYTTTVSHRTLDECPMAYKNMEDIVNNIGPTAEIIKVIKPIYNFKAEE